MKKKLIPLWLALATVASAAAEFSVSMFPELNDFLFDFISFYVPATVVLLTTSVMILKRRKIKEVIWSLFVGSVATTCSLVLSHLPSVLGQCIENAPLSDFALLSLLLLMILYLIAVPAACLSAYFYSTDIKVFDS